jgi:hypothetical protein
MTPSREDFQRWLEDSVTDYVMRAHLAMSEKNRLQWQQVSWDNGIANQRALDELRTRADAYRAIAEMSYEDVCNANGDEPNAE